MTRWWGDIRRFRTLVSVEALIWVVGLAWVALSDPRIESRFTLFLPYYLFGIKSPGCGLGHSVGWLFRGEVLRSIQAHWFGIPAVAILIARIIRLTLDRVNQYRKGEQPWLT